MNFKRVLLASAMGLFVVSGCGDSATPPALDGGSADGGSADGGSADGGALDGGGTDDGGVLDGGGADGGSADGGVLDSDAAISDPDGGITDLDAALTCAAGVECTNYAAVLAAAPRGATDLANCVVQLHQSDCCGATDANGINHGARTTLCPAEASCVAMYTTPAGCADATITTDTGETTTVAADVRLRIVAPAPCGFDPSVTCYTCETFVCTTGPCRSAPGIAGGCGP